MDFSAYDIYALFCTEGIGNRKINRLVKSGFSGIVKLREILTQTSEDISEIFPDFREIDIESLKSINLEAIRAQYEMLINNGVEMITCASNRFPSKLSEKLGSDSPSILFCLGNLEIISKCSVAIVGSRNVSDKGKEVAGKLVERLKDLNVSIISGGAKGIDSAAHYSAVEYGLDTVVVLAHGINHVFKHSIDDEVMRKVLFLSQFHPDSGWSPAFAMIRNKTVCVLSSAIFVVEASESGGTLNTGETALKMEIPLYVISPTEFDTPPPGNRYLISRGGREIYLDSDLGL